MKSIKKVIALVFLILLPASLLGHDNWIDYTSASANSITIKICGGHHFPRSDYLIKKRIVNYCKVKTPDGTISKIILKEENNYLVGQVRIRAAGTYIVYGGLKNPPRYFMKMIYTKGNASVNNNINLGEKLEIVPDRVPAISKVGERINLTVFYQGKPVQADISCTINGTTNFSSFTNSKGTYSLKLRRKGRYMVATSYQGKNSTLLFLVR